MSRSLAPALSLTLSLGLLACSQAGSPEGATARPPGPQPRAAGAAPALPSTGRRPANFNALSLGKASLGAPAARATLPRGTLQAQLHLDAPLGVPSFLWAPPAGASAALARPAAPRGGPVEAARAHLASLAPAYALTAEDVARAVATRVHDTGRGPVVVTFRQFPGGLEVFREEASVALTRDHALVAVAGHLAPAAAAASARAGGAFSLDAPAAVAAALTDLTGEAFGAADLAGAGRTGRYTRLDLAPGAAAARGERLLRPAGAKQVWFRLPAGLEAAWQVEVSLARLGEPEPLTYGYVVSALDGRVLFRKDHQEHQAYAYRVWASDPATLLPDDGPQGLLGTPHPAGLPDGYQAPAATRSLVTLQSLPFSRNDPWLPAGAVETSGNNVDAYADLTAPDGFTSLAQNPASLDQRAALSGPAAFDHPYDLALAPAATTAQLQAAVTQLFYDVNALHDWFYDAGFDEAAGNAQQDNYGRGGVDGDPLLAQAQDYSGLNNANMTTPPDGFSPWMQMYLWNNSDLVRIRVDAPASIAGLKDATSADFGAQSFQTSGPLVLALAAPAGAGLPPSQTACSTLTNPATAPGQIALIDRGTCTFVVKVKNAQLAGYAGALIRNVDPAQVFLGMSGTDASITIPVLLIRQADGEAIGAALAAGPVAVTLQRSPGLRRDGTLDNLIVAHEWGHYLSSRLVQDSAGLDSVQARGMGEGWGDFLALLQAVREEDAAAAVNAGWGGTYATAGWVGSGLDAAGDPNQGYYYGIRRAPYSTDMSRAPLTFGHVSDGVALPVITPPVLFTGAPNSEVHNAGEVWASALWECYAALLRDTTGPAPRLTFAEANLRMREYLVASLKLTPQSPTFLEGRDALLAAALAGDRDDFDRFWAAFAKRGFGVGAVAPARFSDTNAGAVESFSLGGLLVLEDVTFGGVTSGCDDGDATLDDGETGVLTLRLRNTGASALGAGRGTILSTNGHVTFPDGLVSVGPSVAGGLATATARVSLAGAATDEVAAFQVSFEDGYLAAPTTVTFSLRLDVDLLHAASATDGFEGQALAWATTQGVPGTDGFIRDLGLTGLVNDHVLFGPDPGTTSDLRATSPALQVGPGPLVLSWDHAFGFEADPAGTPARAFYDGGVVELSSDGGATWADVGGPLYNGVITATGFGNPLEGRPGFVDFSPSFAASGLTDHVSLDLGTSYAGQTVQVRFRIGSDSGFGIYGWLIDGFQAEGILNTPFDLLTADARRCVNRPPSAAATAPAEAPEGTEVALSAAGSSDPDAGTTLGYAWTQTAGPPVTLTGAATATATFTAPAVDAATPFAFLVTVSDGALSSSATAQVTVVNLNHPPVASAGAPQAVASGAAVSLDGRASSDPDAGATLSYAWTQASGPAVALAGALTATPTFTAPAGPASLTFQLAVSDGTATSTASTTVTVEAAPASGGGGCGCSAAGGDPAALVPFLLGLGLLWRRRARPAA